MKCDPKTLGSHFLLPELKLRTRAHSLSIERRATDERQTGETLQG